LAKSSQISFGLYSKIKKAKNYEFGLKKVKLTTLFPSYHCFRSQYIPIAVCSYLQTRCYKDT